MRGPRATAFSQQIRQTHRCGILDDPATFSRPDGLRRPDAIRREKEPFPLPHELKDDVPWSRKNGGYAVNRMDP